jgi:hypothetical protein
MAISGAQVFMQTTEIDPVDLRRAILFWDKLVWPASSGLYIAGTPDTDFLETCGVLARPKFQVNGDLAQALAVAFIHAFRFLEDREPGQWLLSQGTGSLQLDNTLVERDRGAMLAMYGAIPIPNREVPLEDVLNFRSRRIDEIAVLRTAIDEFYQNWVNSEDKAHALSQAISRIDIAAADMVRVAKESSLPFSMSTLKLNFSISGADVLKAVSVFSLTSQTLSLTTSLLTSALAAISFGSDIGLRKPRTNSPFSFVASLEKQLF